ncbi:hypothetical protein GUJ93_ZPchr0007g3963 [Zizania palustris]|uniref:Uncharacterized protein n=1 Tax=Zizania palustris TaxID=103762 RepID=A0A8J5W5L1_ZIZPA|nr:hypothetical protein GUJ93_ZPchr0007g3963 [Zizania palustris]
MGLSLPKQKSKVQQSVEVLPVYCSESSEWNRAIVPVELSVGVASKEWSAKQSVVEDGDSSRGGVSLDKDDHALALVVQNQKVSDKVPQIRADFKDDVSVEDLSSGEKFGCAFKNRRLAPCSSRKDVKSFHIKKST